MICERQPAISHPHQDGPYLRVGLGFCETKTAICLSRKVRLLRHCTPQSATLELVWNGGGLFVVGKGEIMLAIGSLMATSWLVTSIDPCVTADPNRMPSS